MIDLAAAELGVGALRHLECAIRELREGWQRESGVHLRAIWEACRDLAFVLAWRDHKQGAERLTMARRYLALRFLRAPTLVQTVAERATDSDADPRRIALFRSLQQEFDDRALDPKKHWSGLGPARIAALARSKIDDLAGQKVYDSIERTTYDATAMQSHSDPGMELLMPRDRKGRPSPDPTGADHLTTSPLNAYAVAALLSLLLASRIGAPELTDARDAFERLPG